MEKLEDVAEKEPEKARIMLKAKMVGGALLSLEEQHQSDHADKTTQVLSRAGRVLVVCHCFQRSFSHQLHLQHDVDVVAQSGQ